MPASIASFYVEQSNALAVVDRFLGPFGGNYGDTTPEVWVEMPFAATLRNLRVATVNGFIGNAGIDSTAYTVRVNGVDSALTCTVAMTGSGPTSGSDTTNSVAVSAGDKVSLKFRHNNSPSNTNNTHITASVEVVTTTGLRNILHWCPTGASPATAARFPVEFSGGNAALTAESFLLVPTAGTLRNLRVTARTAPTGANSTTYTVRVNGVDTSIACTIAHSASPHAGQDTSNTAAVSAGDRVSLKLTMSGLPSTNGADFLASLEFEQ